MKIKLTLCGLILSLFPITVNSEYFPNDPYFPNQKYLSEIDYKKLWNYSYDKDNEIIIAIIDSGLNPSHEFDNAYKPHDAVTGANYITDDKLIHGGLVYSIIASKINNGYGMSGIIGNYPIKIMPINISHSPNERFYKWDNIVKAIKYAIDNKADVVNMSFTSPFYYEALNKVIQEGVSKGITFVAASGNGGRTEYNYPASFDNVVSVGSIDQDLKISHFTSVNDRIDIYAKGNGLDVFDGNYFYNTYGTSLSTPIVASTIGIMKLVNPYLSNKQIETILKDTAIDIEGSDVGAVDINRAVAKANSIKKVQKWFKKKRGELE